MASLGPSPLFWHIATTVAGLSKKTYKASVEELGQLCSLYGVEARIFLVACLLAEARDTRVPPNSMKAQLLNTELSTLAAQSNFASIITQAFEAAFGMEPPSAAASSRAPTLHSSISSDFMHSLIKTAKLDAATAVVISVALMHSSQREVAQEGFSALLPALERYASKQEGASAATVPAHVVQTLLFITRTHSLFVADLAKQREVWGYIQAAHSDVAG
ncbi:Aste57867_23829, partial [Symbiodinium sp. KB8]